MRIPNPRFHHNRLEKILNERQHKHIRNIKVRDFFSIWKTFFWESALKTNENSSVNQFRRYILGNETAIISCITDQEKR